MEENRCTQICKINWKALRSSQCPNRIYPQGVEWFFNEYSNGMKVYFSRHFWPVPILSLKQSRQKEENEMQQRFSLKGSSAQKYHNK